MTKKIYVGEIDLHHKLREAVIRGDIKKVRELILSGADPEKCDIAGNTSYRLAAWYGHAEIAEMLLNKYGSELNKPDKYGTTALMDACNFYTEKHKQTAKMLIKHGADVNAKDLYGYTPLMRASRNCEKETEIALLLLDHGANVNAQTKGGSTSLMYACRFGCTEMVKLLMARGADVNIESGTNNMQNKRTALSTACEYGFYNIAKIIVESKTFRKQNDGDKLLIDVCTNGYTETAKVLLEHGWDANTVDFLGYTALMKASAAGWAETVSILLEYSANTDTRDDDGATALIHACKNIRKNTGSVKVLLAAGADPDIRDNEGKTALMSLAEQGRVNVMRVLFKAGADPDIRDNNGRTALDILKEHYPQKYDRWIQNTVVKSRQKTLQREDSRRSRRCEPDFDI